MSYTHPLKSQMTPLKGKFFWKPQQNKFEIFQTSKRRAKMQAHIVTKLELTAHGNYKEWIANINSTLLNLTAMVGSSLTLLEMFLSSKSI